MGQALAGTVQEMGDFVPSSHSYSEHALVCAGLFGDAGGAGFWVILGTKAPLSLNTAG